ncbi:MAG: DUF2142 domain-containing protein [Acidimicrobiaceae bacterium]|nr:DUF2142 domain-containing protein [Acidimicrobiaceae bacterium]
MTVLATAPQELEVSALRALALRWLHASPATWFLVVVVPFGLAILALLPPSQGLDESNHFYRVYSITDGHILPVHQGNRWGGEIPACDIRYQMRVFSQAATPGGSIDARNFLSTPPGCGNAPAKFVAFENTSLYSPVAYAPQVVGLWLSRATRLPLPVQFYAGRVLGLLTFVLIVYMALRAAPRGRLVLLVVAAMPMSVVEATGYSADGMTIALGLLSTALIIRCVAKEDAGIGTFAALGVALLALSLCKSTYFLLAPLVLLVPGRMFPSRAWEAAAKGAVLAAVALVSFAWYEQVKDISLALWRPGVFISPRLQLEQILHRPLWYAHILFRSVAEPGQDVTTIGGFVSWFGFIRAQSAGWAGPPLVVILLGYFTLLIAYQIEIGRRYAFALPRLLAALLPLVLTVGIWVAIFTAGVLTFEPVGNPDPNSFYGRYLLPIAAVPAISVAFLWRARLPRPQAVKWVPFIAVLLVYAVVKEVIYYY